MQFIPSTYASFAARTQLGLIPDFETGLKNHVNAIRASAAHLDDSLASLPSEVRAIGMGDDKVKEYLAAAYNGGYSKVRTAIQIWDEQISGAYQPHEILSRSRLYPETINYVKKLRAALPVFQRTFVQLASQEI
jgi:soluble lytic murein transglycosylase-like protein